MPLVEPYRTGFGEETTVQGVLIRITSGDMSVWSESTPLGEPLYSSEWAGGAYEVICRWLAPAIIDVDISSPRELTEALGALRGNRFAKAALDTAWWILDAALAGVP